MPRRLEACSSLGFQLLPAAHPRGYFERGRQMAKVIGFSQSPLSPFLGEWVRDPMSVSRNRVAKQILGADGLTRLWSFGSMTELTEYLATDSELAKRYNALAGMGGENRLVV